MKHMLRTVLLIALTLLAPHARAGDLQPAPDFTLPTEQGELTLSKLNGEVVYLDFWASWCAPCRDSFEWMNRMQSHYRAEGLTVIAINLDHDRSKAEAFLAKHPAQFTILYDPGWELAGRYQVTGLPSSFLIDQEGRIAVSHQGFRRGDDVELHRKIVNLLAGRGVE